MKQTKLDRTIAILKRGYTTSLECAQQGGSNALSQRVGDMMAMTVWYRDFGVPRFEFAEKWVKTPGGARVKAWKITKDRQPKAGHE